MSNEPDGSPQQPQSDLAHFERNLRELEALVEGLEKGDLSLEESLRQFERGMQLTRACQTTLRVAEQKIEVLGSDEGVEVLQPINPPSAEPVAPEETR